MMIVYKTKASLLIKLLFAVVIMIMLIMALIEKSPALFTITLVFGAVVLYIFYTTHYTVFENTLTIKSGFLFSESIAIDSIKKITRKRKNMFTGPGFSVDRLIIEYNEHDIVIIAPCQQKAFVSHLKRINPDIAFSEFVTKRRAKP